MSLQAQFDKAVKIVQGLPAEGPVQPSPNDKLKFYAYYKQANIGDVNTPRPGLLEFTGKAKWDAWKGVEGTSKDDAQKAYVENLVAVLREHDDDESQKYLAEIEAA